MCFLLWFDPQYNIIKAYKYDLFLYSHFLTHLLIDCNRSQYNKKCSESFSYTKQIFFLFCLATNIILLYMQDLCSKSLKSKSVLLLYSIPVNFSPDFFKLHWFPPIYCSCQDRHISICFLLLLLRNKVASLCRVPMCQLC